MRTSSPNSKKCSTVNLGKFALPGALSVALLTALVFFPGARASQNKNLRAALLSEIHHNSSTSFDRLLVRWQQRYGIDAIPALVSLARDRRAADPDRYVALMGAAKIGGHDAAPLITPLLKDPSWMIRDGSLRALAALDNEASGPQVLPLLKDPALVVRLEAIQSVERLRPQGAAQALLAMVSDTENYHHGKAQWVPQRALEALLHLKTLRAITDGESRATALRLSALLVNRDSPALADPALKEQIAVTVRALKTID